MLEIKFIFSYLWGLVAHTRATWEKLRESQGNESNPDYQRAHYYLPMLGVGAVCIFLLRGNGVMVSAHAMPFDAPFNLEQGLKGVISFILPFLAGPILANLLIHNVYDRFVNTEVPYTSDQLSVFVNYCASIDMAIEVICAFFPTLSFLSFAKLYILAVLWTGASAYLNIDKSNLSIFTVVAFLSVYGSPIVVGNVLKFLTRT